MIRRKKTWKLRQLQQSPVHNMAPTVSPDDCNNLPMKMENQRKTRSSTIGLTKFMGSYTFSTPST